MLDQSSELTINATAFKARCLGLMDDLSRGRLKSVRITKHGKVVSVMTVADAAIGKPEFVDDGQYPSYWGCMKTPRLDLTEEDWEAIKCERAALADEWPTPEEMDRDIQAQMDNAG